jgi:RNA polymerase sigma factor (sigma-70 family)
MTNRLLHTILRKAEALTDGPTDADLLRRCEAARDDAAFAVLIHRHGPMVWAVCRRMLPNPADAEDAFQAVFLAVVRSAGKLGRVNSLGGWLHGVAVRACLQLRRGAVRRKQRERASAKAEAAGAEPPSADWADLHAAVHEEVERLPAALRTAFVLCELQGVRQPDAAAQLGWKLGTLSGRLTRARQQLLKNLSARGLTPLAVAGAVGGAGLPAALADQAMALHTIGPDAVSGLSPTVLELARGATEGMMTKAKWTVGSLMMAGGLLVALGGLPTTDAQQPARTRPDVGPGSGSGAGGPATPIKAPPSADVAEDVAPAPSAAPAKLPPRTTSAPSATQRYEHTVLTTPPTQEELVKLLQKQEKAGWEFCGSVHAETDGIKHYSALVFKRPRAGATTTSPTATYPTLPAGGYGHGSADTYPAPASYNPLTPSTNLPATAVPADVATDPLASVRRTTPAPTTSAPAAGSTLPALPPSDLSPTQPGAPKPASNRPSKPAAGPDTPDVTVVKLKQLSAQAAQDLITPILGDSLKGKGGTADVVTVPDAATVVIYGATKGQIDVITALLAKLDVASPTTGAKK